jgi:hypothetical protein
VVAGVIVGEILTEDRSFGAHGLHLLKDGGGIAGFLGRARVVDGHPGTGTGEAQGDGAADFTAGAGHQGCATCQAERDEGV